MRDTHVSEGMANMPESREEAEDEQSGEKALGSCVGHPTHPLMMGQVAEKHEYGRDKWPLASASLATPSPGLLSQKLGWLKPKKEPGGYSPRGWEPVCSGSLLALWPGTFGGAH